ncbi:ankyrin repeat domain-containing protein [bacterium]|nr:ankyrin repeat domain-containing protein [bacterium]
MSDHGESEPEPFDAAELRKALGEGDPAKVRALLAAGADIRYTRPKGSAALINAVHGRDVARDPRLLDLLTLLVEYGVDLNAVSEYEESGLRVLSRVGRFDAVRLLLRAGADVNQLAWTPLIAAVALGTAADVRAELDRDADLEEQDWWSRTAWLVAMLAGDLDKAKLLRERGADTSARGRCGQPPAFYAIHGRAPATVLRWLMRVGVDVLQVDDYGTTPLGEAAAADDPDAVATLLAAGAEIDEGEKLFGTALARASSPAMIRRLLDAGADPVSLSCYHQRILIGLPETRGKALAEVSPDEFWRAPTRYFGGRNPDLLREPFWEAMIRDGVCAYSARKRFVDGGQLGEPVWCADRYGQSLTLLPDGRAVQIAGEHEDSYDPDFCIYNDVFVHEPGGGVAIYGYPEDVFPPTDFHTATLVGDAIYVIGSLGYHAARRPGETPVYRLDVHTMRMDRVEVGGDPPGWIFRHRAVVTGPHTIRVWGGEVITGPGAPVANTGTFVLDLTHRIWYREVTPDEPGA